jgi:hypothetical protein
MMTWRAENKVVLEPSRDNNTHLKWVTRVAHDPFNIFVLLACDPINDGSFLRELASMHWPVGLPLLQRLSFGLHSFALQPCPLAIRN